MKNIIMILALVLSLVACGDKKDDPTPQIKPVAAFTISSELFLNQSATIANTSTDATAYVWDFGDGTTGTGATPTKSYTTAGTYTVKLTATGQGGTATTTKQVIVKNGTHSVVVKNNTANSFKIILFDRIDDNTLGAERFVIENLASGQTSAAFVTSKTKIGYGGVFNGFNFVVMAPRHFDMTTGQVNTININNDTQLMLGLTVPMP